jgi:hypothetical protein
VGASDWTALAAASVLLDYEGHEMKPVRGPRSLVSGDAADQDAAIRARLLPLLAKAAPLADKPLPGLPDAGPPVFAQGPLRMLALQPPLGVVAQVCDDSPDSRGSLRALFWVREDRITVLEPPTLKAGFVEQMSGTLQLESCPLLLDVADLDGDGVPELLTAETGLSGGASGATVRVLTLSSPAAVRHTLAQSSREIAAKENAATGASHGEEGPKTDAGASE